MGKPLGNSYPVFCIQTHSAYLPTLSHTKSLFYLGRGWLLWGGDRILTLSALFSEWPACLRMAKDASLDSPVTSRHIPSHVKKCWPINEGNWNKTPFVNSVYLANMQVNWRCKVPIHVLSHNRILHVLSIFARKKLWAKPLTCQALFSTCTTLVTILFILILSDLVGRI